MNSPTTNSQFVANWKLNIEICALKRECERQVHESERKLKLQIQELESRIQRESLKRSMSFDWFLMHLPVLTLWILIILTIVSDHARH